MTFGLKMGCKCGSPDRREDTLKRDTWLSLSAINYQDNRFQGTGISPGVLW